MFKKEYTIDDLKMREVYTSAYGWWSHSWNPRFDVNYSSILTKLIQEAGRWCESYASDLFIDWTSLVEKWADRDYEGGSYLFGFRQNGVDHLEYVLSRLNSGDSKEYRAVWRLDVEVEEDKLTMKLGRVYI